MNDPKEYTYRNDREELDAMNVVTETLPSMPVETSLDTPELSRVMDLMHKAVDAGQSGALADLHKIYTQERTDSRIRAYMRSKLDLQRDLPEITKDGVITNKAGEVQSRFSSYPHLKAIIDPIMLEHSFVLDHRTGINSELKVPTVEAVLQHPPSGHIEYGGPMMTPLDTSGNKNAIQGSGSALSYGKRYTTIAILGIVERGVDTDGNGPVITPQSLAETFEQQVHESRKAAAHGMQAYTEWFGKQSQTVRGYLVDSGTHGENKKAAEAHSED